MHPAHALERVGGVADRATLLKLTTRRRLRTAVSSGDILRITRNRYVLPAARNALRAAAKLSGVVSHDSAAALHGWEMATKPERPHVTVPRNRRIDPYRRKGITVHWSNLKSGDSQGNVTSYHRTVIDCAKDLPFAQALSIADSAFRHDHVDRDKLMRMALAVRSAGRAQAIRVVDAADLRAANAFESALRSIALDVPGLNVEPQVYINAAGYHATPDLVDAGLRIVIEADSFEFHGSRKALVRDCERYNALQNAGWKVLRFSYEHVMFQPEYVRQVLVAAVARAGEGPLEHAGVTVDLEDTA